jgi:hypothetical protein
VNTVPSATFTATPLDVGSVKVGVAALAGAVIVNFPDAVLLANAIDPVDVPGMPRTGAVVYPGAAVEAVALPNTVPPAALLKLNVSAGVVVAVATEVVNRGLRVPALKDVTVPEPKPEMADAKTTAPVPVVPLDKSEAAGCVAVNTPVLAV